MCILKHEKALMRIWCSYCHVQSNLSHIRGYIVYLAIFSIGIYTWMCSLNITFCLLYQGSIESSWGSKCQGCFSQIGILPYVWLHCGTGQSGDSIQIYRQLHWTPWHCWIWYDNAKLTKLCFFSIMDCNFSWMIKYHSN